MARSDLLDGNTEPVRPLVGDSALGEAAEMMLAASRTMLAAASAMPGIGASDTRAREMTAEAVETGMLRALRRDSLLGESDSGGAATSLLGLPTNKGIPGAGYGRMGATLTGHGARSQLYGTIGGAIGFAVGGPVGAFVGGMLGGLFGDDDDGAEQARQQEQLARQWLNSPGGFEEEAYLYNLALGTKVSAMLASLTAPAPPSGRAAALRAALSPVMVNFSPGAVQITGSGAEAGERAARAFAGELGRVLRLNSVVVPAAGFGEI